MAEFLPLPDADQSLIHDEDVVAMEGFTQRIPFAAGHEVIRQKCRHLTLIRMTSDLIYDQLIGMGCADKLIFSWGGNPGVGSLHRLRDAVERFGLKPLARVAGMAAGGVAPRVMGMGPVPAVRKLLEHLDWRLDSVDVLELHEAFASQALACLRQLGLADDDEMYGYTRSPRD